MPTFKFKHPIEILTESKTALKFQTIFQLEQILTNNLDQLQSLKYINDFIQKIANNKKSSTTSHRIRNL